MECWWAQPSSHDQCAEAFTDDVRSWNIRSCDLAETKTLLGILEGRGDTDVQNQLDGIIRNKAIYLKVANAMAKHGYSRTQGSVDLVATNLRLL